MTKCDICACNPAHCGQRPKHCKTFTPHYALAPRRAKFISQNRQKLLQHKIAQWNKPRLTKREVNQRRAGTAAIAKIILLLTITGILLKLAF